MNPQPSSFDDHNEFADLCRHFSDRSSQPMVAVEGATHVIRYSNQAFIDLSGRSAADLVGSSFADIATESESAECLAHLDRVYRSGFPSKLAEQLHRETPPAYWSYDMWAVTAFGELPIGVMIQVTDATESAIFRREARAMNEALLVSSVRQHELIDSIRRNEDLRRELESQMHQARKLESLGILAGGLAHDLNNLLTPVLGFSEMAFNELPTDSPAVPMLEYVVEHSRRAAALVQKILAYAGKGQMVFRTVDLSVLVREMTGLLRSAVSEPTELRFELAPNLTPIDADASQLFQVVLGLVNNASESLPPTGGIITVRTGPFEMLSPDDPSRISTPSVFLEVVDTGCGMTAEMIERIFDPFFTTKFLGRGLGLAVAQGIARSHGGFIEVHSRIGSGSTFRLALPGPLKPPAKSSTKLSDPI
jgi:signal transduction histidine kinase